MSDYATIQITPYFADGEKYPSLIGVRAEGDEHETAYVKKSDMAKAVDYWRRMYEETVKR
jgi:pentatricopeptide repeat protein